LLGTLHLSAANAEVGETVALEENGRTRAICRVALGCEQVVAVAGAVQGASLGLAEWNGRFVKIGKICAREQAELDCSASGASAPARPIQ
jgi:hypothetical protein